MWAACFCFILSSQCLFGEAETGTERVYFFSSCTDNNYQPQSPRRGGRKFPPKLIIYCYIYSSPCGDRAPAALLGLQSSGLRLCTTDGRDMWEPGMGTLGPCLQDKHVHLPLLPIRQLGTVLTAPTSQWQQHSTAHSKEGNQWGAAMPGAQEARYCL